MVSDSGVAYASTTLAAGLGPDTAYAGLRADNQGLKLRDPGFVGDAPELRTMRLRQGNPVGPAGFVSMEDGADGGFVQRGVAAAGGQSAIVGMGGEGAETRATEASVGGFWKAWRTSCGFRESGGLAEVFPRYLSV